MQLHRHLIHIVLVITTVFSIVSCQAAPQTAKTTSTPSAVSTAQGVKTPTRPADEDALKDRGKDPRATATQTQTPTTAPTATPKPEVGLDPAAWLEDEAPQSLSPSNPLIIHFNTPMNSSSSAAPVYSWPELDGRSEWNSDRTALTFSPLQPVDSLVAYTFFLDPELTSSAGKAFNNPPTWYIQFQPGVKVKSISPAGGNLSKFSKTITITFDRAMDQKITPAALKISPEIPFDLTWQDEFNLTITLEEFLQPGVSYHLTLHPAVGDDWLLAADGSTLAADVEWQYNQEPLTSTVSALTDTTLQVDFNYAPDIEKTGLPFTISPAIAGEWTWSGTKLNFTAEEPIPADQRYTLSLAQPLVTDGQYSFTTIPETSFSGMAPIHLSKEIFSENNEYNSYRMESDRTAIEIFFYQPVDRASAEKAFSLSPTARGKFSWRKSADGSIDIMTYSVFRILDRGTTFKINFDTGIRSSAGGTYITEPASFTFSTPYYGSDQYSFGEGGANIQVLDEHSQRLLSVNGYNEDLRFTAYSYELTDYVRLYEGEYHDRYWGDYTTDIAFPAGVQPAANWDDFTEESISGDGISRTVLPTWMPAGLYLVNMYLRDTLCDQIFVVISQNTLSIKTNGGEMVAWLNSTSGKPVDNAEIIVYGSKGDKLRMGPTDQNGIYQVEVPTDQKVVLVTARQIIKGQVDDIVIVGVDEDFESRTTGEYYNYYYWNDVERPSGKPYLVYPYTERPIYQPGQTINFKVLIRKDDDMQYSLPEEGTPVMVDLIDVRKNKLDQVELTTNRFGTVNGTFTLSEGVNLGYYSLKATCLGVEEDIDFQVQEYQKPEMKIEVTPQNPEKLNRFVAGDNIDLKVKVSYYFGEPAANITLNVYSSPSRDTQFSITTDENGEALITSKASYRNYYDFDLDSWGWHHLYTQWQTLVISFTPASGQEITSGYQYQVYPTSQSINLSFDDFWYQPDQEIHLSGSVSDLMDQPVAGKDLLLSVNPWNRTSGDFESGTENKLVTDTSGKFSQTLQLDEGFYKLVVKGKDDRGNSIYATDGIYVMKDTSGWFSRSDYWHLTINAEKDSYKPFERARFLIESTFSGPALVTFERGSVINYKLINLTAPITEFETDIIPEHAPNVFVTVNTWKPVEKDSEDNEDYHWGVSNDEAEDLLIATTEISVDASAKELDIQVSTDQPTYQPGDTAAVSIQVADSAGNPVEAELSLALVDESIFALTKDEDRNIFEAYYGERDLSVFSYDSFAPWRYLHSPDYGGGGDSSSSMTRSDFRDTAVWIPVVTTDTNGQATVNVKLPDNTTSWRITVKAITLRDQVGQTTLNFETKRDFFTRSTLPTILSKGDQVTLIQTVHNYTDKALNFQAKFNAAGLQTTAQNPQSLTIQPGEALDVQWPVKVNMSTPTNVTFSVMESGGLSDAIRLPLAVQPATVVDLVNQTGLVNGSAQINLVKPGIDPETSQVVLTLNRSMGTTILEGVDYLIGYPYGCVEQTMSRAMPNAVVARAADQLGLGGQGLKVKLDPLVKASVDQLYSMQHSDGGWGWWLDDETDNYQTAWVLVGLSWIKDSGYPVEQQVIDRAVSFFTDEYSGYVESDPKIQAFVYFALAEAGAGDLDGTRELVSTSLTSLDPFSQASLAVALTDLGQDAEARQIIDELSRSATSNGAQTYWPQSNSDGVYHQKTMSSTIRTTAMVLMAYLRVDPDNEHIPSMVQYLVDHRRGNQGWGTTNETSYTIAALTNYLTHQAEQSGSQAYEVKLNGSPFSSGTLDLSNQTVQLTLPLEQLRSGINQIQVLGDGGMPIYYTLTSRYTLLIPPAEPTGAIKVKIRYTDALTKKEITTFQKGQKVVVHISMDLPEPAYYVSVEDILPGGIQPINELLNTNLVYSQKYMDSDDYYWEMSYAYYEYGYNFKEIRDDRVVFFITTLEAGPHEIMYNALVTGSGTFSDLPVTVSAMYDPSVWGRTGYSVITVQP